MRYGEHTIAIEDLPEERLNQLTHGVGLLLSVIGAFHLLAKTPIDSLLTLGYWIYALALVGLYAASTLSHSFITGPARSRWRTLDQLAIFAVMAATYTPVSFAACREGWWHVPLVLMWLMAGLGVYLKLRVTREQMVPVWFYVILGWIPMIACQPIFAQIGLDGLFWVVTGGICYLLGVVFLTNDHRSRYFHPAWHILVIMGSMCHYVVISGYTTPAG